jgi:DNA-binding transcriptional MerR regulator/methylmalonyl-CoA mutase cobalamin-binding subunit
VQASPGPYRIQIAAELSGVLPATLRAWERRYGVPVPRRTASAYRLYTVDDVELVRRMRKLVDGGIAPAEAARSVLASAAPVAANDSAPTGGGDGLDLAQARLLAAAQRYDADAIDAELTRLSMLVDAQTLYEKVLGPVVVEIGKRWADGTLSVAQEHLLSERIETTLRAAVRTLERRDGPLALLGCIESESHVIGLLGASLRFATSGARVTLLGAVTPPSAVADAVASLAPRVVGLSVASKPKNARALFAAYAKACGSTQWVVGGGAIASVEDAVVDAGGIVAHGPATQWQANVRDWLRGAR